MRRRSILFTPGTRGDRVERALRTGAADVVVADLEDSVAPADKAAARAAVRAALEAVPESSAERAVRINAWPSALAEEDLDAVLPTAPELLVIPKAEDPAAIRVLHRRLGQAEEESGLEDGHFRLLLILETARGVLAAQELACCDRVVALAFGAEDLAADAGMRRTPGNAEVMVPRSLVALAAAAQGVQAIDMITADYRDTGRTRREAGEARDLGYAGKMCLHPDQVAVVHDAFAPTADEVAWAERVVAATEAAGAGSGGVVVVDGRMIDVPLVEQARRILADR